MTSSDDRFSTLKVSAISTNVGDADAPGVVLRESDGSTEVAESDVSGLSMTDVYTLMLTMAPAGHVFITVAPDPPKEKERNQGARSVQVRKGTQDASADSDIVILEFTPDNWFIPQTVVVTAHDDSYSNEGIKSYAIKHTVIEEKPNEDGLVPLVDIDSNNGDAYDGRPFRMSWCE